MSLGETIISSPVRHFWYTVQPVLEITCIKRPPALRDHCSDTKPFLSQPSRTYIYPFPKRQNIRLFKTDKRLQTTIINLMKMEERYLNG